jgi:translation elongation factor EF-Tu-like GTPase
MGETGIMGKQRNSEEIWQRWIEEYKRSRPVQEPAIDLTAEITFLTSNEGGRRTFVLSGYRGQFYYDGSDWDATYVFSHDPVEPGESVEALILLINRTAHQGRFYPGKEFEIREGNRAVARGRIIWVWTQMFLRSTLSETDAPAQS